MNKTAMPANDTDYELLRQLTTHPEASQRNLASRLGISVGKLNYCLRALIEKGWVKVKNFRRSDNKLAYAYVLTPSGAAAKLFLARQFLASKEREYEVLVAEIQTLRMELDAATTSAGSTKFKPGKQR